jgi:hypothetical protein
MSYQSMTQRGLYVLRWGTRPEVADVERYSSEIAAARQAQGRPLVGLFIVPSDSAVPDEPFRKAQAARLPAIMSNLSFAVAVFEGEGFFASLRRSALVSILMLAPKRFPVHVRATLEEALLERPPGELGFDPHRAIAEIRGRGLG